MCEFVILAPGYRGKKVSQRWGRARQVTEELRRSSLLCLDNDPHRTTLYWEAGCGNESLDPEVRACGWGQDSSGRCGIVPFTADVGLHLTFLDLAVGVELARPPCHRKFL